MKDDSQGRQQGENNNNDNLKKKKKKSPKELRLFPREDAELLKGLPPKMLLA